jgi:hypothetical protein
MTWNNVPHNHIIFLFLDCGVTNYIFVTKCYDKFTCCEHNFKVFSFANFVNKNVLTPFEHDLHVRVFTMMYMFLNFICTKYIKACIHQGLSPTNTLMP